MAHAQIKAIGVTTWIGKATRALREATEKRASNQQAREQTRLSVAQDRAVAVTAAVASPKKSLEIQEFQMPSGLEPAVLKPEDEELLRGFLRRMKDRSEPGTLEEYKDKRINLTIIPMLVDVYEGTGQGRKVHTDTLIPGLGALSRQVEGLRREIPRTDKGVPCHEQYQHQRRIRSPIACCAEIQAWTDLQCQGWNKERVLLVFGAAFTLGKINGYPARASTFIWDLQKDPILQFLCFSSSQYMDQGIDMLPRFCDLAEATVKFANPTLHLAWELIAPRSRVGLYREKDFEQASVIAEVTLELFLICVQYRRQHESILQHAFPVILRRDAYRKIVESGGLEARENCWFPRDQKAEKSRRQLEEIRSLCYPECEHRYECLRESNRKARQAASAARTSRPDKPAAAATAAPP